MKILTAVANILGLFEARFQIFGYTLTRNPVFSERGATSSQSGLLRTQSCLISAYPLSFNDIDPTKWVALMPNGLKRRPPFRNGTLWKIGRFLWKHLVHFFENQPKEIFRHLSEKASKGRFPTPERLQNHSNESKELKRKGDKERRRRKSRGLKKSNDCTLRFYNSYLVGRKRAI